MLVVFTLFYRSNFFMVQLFTSFLAPHATRLCDDKFMTGPKICALKNIPLRIVAVNQIKETEEAEWKNFFSTTWRALKEKRKTYDYESPVKVMDFCNGMAFVNVKNRFENCLHESDISFSQMPFKKLFNSSRHQSCAGNLMEFPLPFPLRLLPNQ